MKKQAETNEEIIKRLNIVRDKPESTKIMGELWERNIGLVKMIVHELTGLSEQEDGFEDMTQQAYFGFRAAVYAYNPNQGIKFSTFAGKRIKWELCRYYERNGYTVRIPAYMKKRLKNIAEKKKLLEAETGHAITYETALEALNFSAVAIKGTLNALRKFETESLDRCLYENTEGITLLDMLNSGEDIAENVLMQEWHKELHELLIKALQEVPEDSREIIIRQYFHGVPIWRMANEKGQTRQTLWNKKNTAFKSIRAGKYGGVLAEFMPSTSSIERAQRLIKQDREALERLQISDIERGLLVI